MASYSPRHTTPPRLTSRFFLLGAVIFIALGVFVVLIIDKKPDVTPKLAASNVPATKAPITTATPTVEPIARVPVLMYHYIRVVENPQEDRLGYGLSVTPTDFATQMQYLTDNDYTTITPDDLLLAMQQKKKLPKKPIVLTFDDGYADFYTEAYPVLNKYNLKATAYIVSGFLDDKQGRYLTTDQVKELDNSGLITIGGHTVHHANTAVSVNAKTEIEKGKTDLEKIIGHEVTSFAYPGGTFNNTAVALVEDAGFDIAFTTQEGLEHLDVNRFISPRVRISGGMSIKKFAQHVEGSQ